MRSPRLLATTSAGTRISGDPAYPEQGPSHSGRWSAESLRPRSDPREFVFRRSGPRSSHLYLAPIMIQHRMAVLAFVLLAAAPAVARAQFPERVAVGARVRVWVPEPWLQDGGPWKRQQLRGTVTAVGSDTLQLSIPGTEGTIAVARGSIKRLEISRGRPSRVASAFERAVGGAIVGAAATAIQNDPDNDEWPNYSSDWRAAGQGAIYGAAFGAAIGIIFPTERWRRVRMGR
jgi:hypothetical protein